MLWERKENVERKITETQWAGKNFAKRFKVKTQSAFNVLSDFGVNVSDTYFKVIINRVIFISSFII